MSCMCTTVTMLLGANPVSCVLARSVLDVTHNNTQAVPISLLS
jgi:hypothetical protein